MFQLIDRSNQRKRLWTGGALSALELQNKLEKIGRPVVVQDLKGRRLGISDLYESAALENERHATACLKTFWDLQKRPV